MLKILISLLAIFTILVTTEYFWRKKKVSDESTRKLVHIFVATFVAFWPFYMDYKQIQIIAIAFLVVIIASRYLRIFKGILHVKRKTYGDLFFPLSILILAIIEPNNAVFMMAMLNVGLSDGMAAVIGKKYGKKNSYKIFGHTKSIAGTMSFVLISYLIILLVKLIYINNGIYISWLEVIIIPPILAFVENISSYGADDLTIPLVLMVCLRWL